MDNSTTRAVRQPAAAESLIETVLRSHARSLQAQEPTPPGPCGLIVLLLIMPVLIDIADDLRGEAITGGSGQLGELVGSGLAVGLRGLLLRLACGAARGDLGSDSLLPGLHVAGDRSS